MGIRTHLGVRVQDTHVQLIPPLDALHRLTMNDPYYIVRIAGSMEGRWQ